MSEACLSRPLACDVVPLFVLSVFGFLKPSGRSNSVRLYSAGTSPERAESNRHQGDSTAIERMIPRPSSCVRVEILVSLLTPLFLS